VADRFGWIGTTRQQFVVDWVAAQVREWWGDWSALDAAPAVRLAETMDSLADAGDDATSLLLTTDFFLAIPGPSALAGAFVGVAVDAPGSLASYVGEEATHDLVHRLSRDDRRKASQLPDAAALPPALSDPRLGCVALTVEIGGLALRIRLARRLVDTIHSPERARGVSLTTLRLAIGEASARLRGQLDLGEIALAELRALKPGDVLVTRARLETLPALVIESDGAAVVARAQLGEHRGQRALQLLAP